MRIALFTDTYLPTVNGVARTLGKLVEHASRRGHQVALFSPNVSPEAAKGTVLHHQLQGFPLPMYPEVQVARLLDKKGKLRLDTFDPQVVHTATEAPVGWSGRSWALKSGVPLVTSFHTDFPAYVGGYGLPFLKEGVWRFLRFFHDPAAVTFCPSRSTKKNLQARGFHDRVRIWSRGVDHDLFNPARRKEAVRARIAPGARRILLYIGRLAPEKRVEILLEAFPAIRERAPAPTALVMVGDGPLRGTLEKRAPEGIHFTGYLTGIPLAEAYAAGDIFVFPSDTETFGYVVTEALSSGLPTIAPNRGGVTDMVRPGETGVLVKPRDREALEQAVLGLLWDDEERIALSKGARAAALRQSWPSILDGVLEGYKAAIAKGAPTAGGDSDSASESGARGAFATGRRK